MTGIVNVDVPEVVSLMLAKLREEHGDEQVEDDLQEAAVLAGAGRLPRTGTTNT